MTLTPIRSLSASLLTLMSLVPILEIHIMVLRHILKMSSSSQGSFKHLQSEKQNAHWWGAHPSLLQG